MALTAHMVTIDCADPRSLAKFWSEAVGYEVKADLGEGAFVVLSQPGDGGVRLGLQKVPEPRVGKNRVHVDWSTEDRRGEVARLTGLGATVVGEHAYPGLVWTVLTDPEGNVFCVSGRE
jgi:predicted enzyme related to lactoylglutathione lyase